MSYSHYQHASPAWGTSQFQFGPPPTPSFQSQPYWRGMDFYRAHAATQDPSLFEHAWGRVRDHAGLGTAMGPGVGTHEAQHWHHRAYGLGEVPRMLPAEIGHAAAFEAYRTWTHNSSMYEPLNGDTRRQREGLIGYAVAEAARLLSYVGQQAHNYARLASEAAAATASIIFYENREGEGFRRSRSRSRLRSTGGSYGDPYVYDDAATAPYVRPRSHSRPRSRSHSRPPALQLGGDVSTIPATFPGYANSTYSDSSSTYGTYPGNNIPINMPAHGTPYPRTTVPLGAASSYTSQPYQPVTVQPYQTQVQPYQTQVYQAQPYQTQPMPINIPIHTTHDSHRGRSTSVSYIRQNPYAGTYGNATVAAQPPPQVIVIKSSSSRNHKHHKHHRRHRSSSRSRSNRHSRSISPPYYENHYPDNYRRG